MPKLHFVCYMHWSGQTLHDFNCHSSIFSVFTPFLLTDVVAFEILCMVASDNARICMFYRWVESVSEFLSALHDSPCMHQQKVVVINTKSQLIFDDMI